MKMSLRLFLITGFFGFVVNVLCAQSIQLTKELHDFGKVYEFDGKLIADIEFENTGESVLSVTKIEKGCDCIGAYWMGNPVSPGEKSKLRVEFDPSRRIGTQEHTIKFHSSAKDVPASITLKGFVLSGSSKQNINYEIGPIKTVGNNLNFGYVYNNSIETRIVPLVNHSEEAATVEVTNLPPFVNASIMPQTIEPGAQGVLKMTFNVSQAGDWGFTNYDASINVTNLGSKEAYSDKFLIVSNIIEDFSGMSTEDSLNAPKILIKEKVITLDNISKENTGVQKCQFIIRNTGKDDLVIYAFKPSCGCTIANSSKKVLKKGKETVVEVDFKLTGRTSKQESTITVISNDPENHEELVKISAIMAD